MRPMLLVLAACGGGSPAMVDSAPDAAPPAPPPGLTRYLTGNAADHQATPRGGLILMGGGTDVDAAFAWQRDRIGGGDVVVLRASGADGYNDYLYADIGGIDSVETMLVTSRSLAMEPYVAWQLDHAEAIFLAGGDQSVYVGAWDDTPVATALAAAFARGAVLGGTSAGTAFLAGIVYSARNGSVISNEALADPYDTRITLDRHVVDIAVLADVITDTHFAARDRMGRMLAFAARAIADGWVALPTALGIDEETALLVDATGVGTVAGTGAVYALLPTGPPAQCAAGQPLVWTNVPLHELRAGATIDLEMRTASVVPTSLSASGGALSPTNPY